MYLKLSSLFLLVGLISQTIGAPSQNDEIENLIENEGSVASSNPIDDINEISSSFEREEEIDNESYDIEKWNYRDFCQNLNQLNIFDMDVIQNQIRSPFIPYNDITSDELKEYVENATTSYIERINAGDNSTDVMNQMDKDLTYLILSAKESDLHEVIQTIFSSSKKLIESLGNQNGNLLQFQSFISFKITTLVVLREDPALFIYLLDVFIHTTNKINNYEKLRDVDNMVAALSLTLKKTVKDFRLSRLSENSRFLGLVIAFIDGLADEIPLFIDMETVESNKFMYARCKVDEIIMGLFAVHFLEKYGLDTSLYDKYSM